MWEDSRAHEHQPPPLFLLLKIKINGKLFVS